jgi:hypothetical protein
VNVDFEEVLKEVELSGVDKSKMTREMKDLVRTVQAVSSTGHSTVGGVAGAFRVAQKLKMNLRRHADYDEVLNSARMEEWRQSRWTKKSEQQWNHQVEVQGEVEDEFKQQFKLSGRITELRGKLIDNLEFLSPTVSNARIAVDEISTKPLPSRKCTKSAASLAALSAEERKALIEDLDDLPADFERRPLSPTTDKLLERNTERKKSKPRLTTQATQSVNLQTERK